VPLHNLKLPAGSRVPFGTKFVLQDFPEWLRQDKHILTDIGRTERDLTLAAKHALIAEYDASSFGMPDPEWKGTKPRSIQQLRFQAAILANTALWLIQPSPVSLTVGFHALTTLDNGQTVDPPFVIHTEHEGRSTATPKISAILSSRSMSLRPRSFLRLFQQSRERILCGRRCERSGPG
jgi:hypothetical protein